MNEGLTFDDVLIQPDFSDVNSRSECNPSVMLGGKVPLALPIISSNMDTVTGIKMAKKMSELGGLGIIHRYMTLDELSSTFCELGGTTVGFATGTVNNDKDRIDLLLEQKAEILCVDIAHGDCQQMLDTIKYIRNDKNFTGLLIAGNVATYTGAGNLKRAGADVVKVGVGPGSVCTTRIKTGCGVPQFTAISNAQGGLNKYNGRPRRDISIIADGGIRTPGDAAKALAAGAEAVMIGGMLAGSDCVPGWDTEMTRAEKNWANGDPDKPRLAYRGMASKEARQSFTGTEATNAEGISTQVRALEAGSTERIVQDIAEGVRSAMSYVGARDLRTFQERATFIRVSPATVVENHPHKNL